MKYMHKRVREKRTSYFRYFRKLVSALAHAEYMMREVVFWWILKKQYMRAAITGHILFLKNKIWCWKLVCV